MHRIGGVSDYASTNAAIAQMESRRVAHQEREHQQRSEVRQDARENNLPVKSFQGTSGGNGMAKKIF